MTSSDSSVPHGRPYQLHCYFGSHHSDTKTFEWSCWGRRKRYLSLPLIDFAILTFTYCSLAEEQPLFLSMFASGREQDQVQAMGFILPRNSGLYLSDKDHGWVLEGRSPIPVRSMAGWAFERGYHLGLLRHHWVSAFTIIFSGSPLFPWDIFDASWN